MYVHMKVLLWFVADITKNVLKEHAKAFNQVFDRAKKDLQKVHIWYAWLSSQPSVKRISWIYKHTMTKRKKVIALNQVLGLNSAQYFIYKETS